VRSADARAWTPGRGHHLQLRRLRTRDPFSRRLTDDFVTAQVGLALYPHVPVEGSLLATRAQRVVAERHTGPSRAHSSAGVGRSYRSRKAMTQSVGATPALSIAAFAEQVLRQSLGGC